MVIHNYTDAASTSDVFLRLDSELPGTVEYENDGDLYFERLNIYGLDDFLGYSLNKKLYTHLEFPPQKSIEETKKYLEKLLSRVGSKVEDRTAMYWFVRKISDNKLVGTIGLLDIDVRRRSAEWGYGVDPEFWGKGCILEMQEKVKHYVFERLSFNRLTSRTSINNSETISSVASAGFKCEGVLRDYYKFEDNGFVDAKIFAMLASEYFNDLEQSARLDLNISKSDIISIISETFNMIEVDENSSMDNIFQWDSLNHIKLIINIEKETGCKIKPKQISQMRSINSIYKILSS
jgi:RimJ/RimL family protein N-acetyltransferase/acyl carrier protein